jgi:hypothetical protein
VEALENTVVEILLIHFANDTIVIAVINIHTFVQAIFVIDAEDVLGHAGTKRVSGVGTARRTIRALGLVGRHGISPGTKFTAHRKSPG